jgi:hypothetical protein
VIGKRYVGQTQLTRRIRPGLEQSRRVMLHPMSLWMTVVIGEELIV